MKALYFRKNNIPEIEKMVGVHGCDTLIVNAFGLHEVGNPAFMPAEEIQPCVTYWKNRGFKVLISIIWNSEANKIGDAKYIESRFLPALKIVADGYICDVENYNDANPTDQYQETKVTLDWVKHAGFCRMFLCDEGITGQMPHRDAPGLMCYPQDVHLFLETTFGGIETWQTIKLFVRRMWHKVRYGLKYEMVPGLYIEDLGDRLEEEKKQAMMVYGGYWIYSDYN